MTNVNHGTGGFALYMKLCGTLRELDALFASGAAGLPEISAEWIRDNYYLIRRCGDAVLSELRALRHTAPPTDGLRNVRSAAAAFVSACPEDAGQRRPFADLAERFLRQWTKRRPLSGGELRLFPAMLQAEAILRIPVEAAENGHSRLPLLISLLRFCADCDFSPLLEAFDPTRQIFLRDPSGVFARMDQASRAAYGERIAELARRSHRSETEIASEFLQKAEQSATLPQRHVGYGLFESRGRRYAKGKALIGVQAALSCAISLSAAVLSGRPAVGFFGLLPVWELLRPPLERAALTGTPPAILPRIELTEIPPDAGVLIAVCTLLPSPENVEAVIRRLCLLETVAPPGTVGVCLLADPKESDYPHPPQDDAVIRTLCRRVREENPAHGGRLFAAVRPRAYLPTQRRYAGAERKRGAVALLCRILAGEEKISSLEAFEGDVRLLSAFRYLMVLDADTELQMSTVTRLVGNAVHPLNAPVAEAGRPVSQGYGIFAPRVGVTLESARQNHFSRIFCGVGGVTAYDNRSSDFYQDLFGEAIFCGKGLIDVRTFNQYSGRFPSEQVLSHDILEGSLLRTAYVSDAEVTDGFPRSAASWLSRLHRWVRGDTQNLVFALPLPGGHAGSLTALSRLSRYQLLDNFRRALTPLCCCICGLSAALEPRPAVAAFLWLMSGARSLLPCVEAALSALRTAGASAVTRRFYSGVLPVFQGQITLGLLQTLLLPQTAYTCTDAVVRALWRTLISRRSLLEWTTAADGDSRSFTLRRFGPQLAFYGTLALTPKAGARLIGLAGLAGTFALPLLEKPVRSAAKAAVNPEKLDLYAAASWKFYESTVGENDHFLPPDNLQESPVCAVAHRTSPTNIGMYLVGAFCAFDFGLIDASQLLTRLSGTISTLEKLEKYHGHLYNWYDTETLRPLRPRYISTVDSGNLACCLTALEQALRELPETAQTRPLAARIRALRDEPDFSLLYDDRRHLFRVGFSVETGTADGGCYDLLMSEARMTGYYAVARRLVPRRHWERLSRLLAARHGYRGPLSWSGTMFEYFMPHLFLPVCDGSMTYEALKFCLFCQQEAAPHGVWGISESGFYAFDPQLNYQYRANGVPALALRRVAEDEQVVSPYSSFLALPFDPSAAAENLERLERRGCFGNCGFYEAVDFCARRTGGQPAVIRSYMAHHVGMSLIAADNCRRENVWQRRFMRDPQMNSAVELLMEKIELGAPVYQNRHRVSLPSAPPPRPLTVAEQFDTVTPADPRALLLCSNNYTLALTDSGSSVSLYNGLDVTRRSHDLLRSPQGVFVLLRDGGVHSLTAAPFYRDAAGHRVTFRADRAVFDYETDALHAALQISVDPDKACEIRRLTLKNRSRAVRTVEIAVYFEPCLAEYAQYAAHPAFSKLFLRGKYDAASGIVTCLRPARNGQPAAALAAGWAESVPTEVCLDRTALLRCPDGIFSLDGVFDVGFGAAELTPDGAVCLRTKLRLEPDVPRSLTFLLAAASSVQHAAERLLAVRHRPKTPPAEAAFPAGLGSRLINLAIPALLFGAPPDPRTLEARRTWAGPQSLLWSVGISGDDPILLVEIEASETADRAVPYLEAYHTLRLHGVCLDLVIVYEENGDYQSPLKNALTAACRSAGVDVMLGAHGGVHLLNRALTAPEVIGLLTACAACVAPHSALSGDPRKRAYLPIRLLSGQPAPTPDRDDAFVCRENSRRPWCLALANPVFGTLVSNRALGFSWAVNAHLGKLTPWTNDDAADNRGELLLLRVNGRVYDLLRGSAAVFYEDRAVYRTQIDGISAEITVGVAQKAAVKRVDCRLRCEAPVTAELAYYLEPQMADRPNNARFVTASYENGALIFENPYYRELNGVCRLSADGGFSGFNCDRPSVLCGRWNDRRLTSSAGLCALAYRTLSLLPDAGAEARFFLSWAQNRSAAAALPALFVPRQPTAKTAVLHSGNGELNRLFNHLLPNQILSCRMLGRTGFSQNGGAWGFRDQLQDALAAIYFAPGTAKIHLLRAAAQQFEEGDVLHWWHRISGRRMGIRTRYRDDFLWLPYAAAQYCAVVGDDSVLKAAVPFAVGEPLRSGERERYQTVSVSERRASLAEHCLLALDHGYAVGPHGLLLIGGGDWNDGFNEVGCLGRGESVWLSMFYVLTAGRFAPYCPAEAAERLNDRAKALRQALEENSWDGQWFLRAFRDDGAPLGGAACESCQIDLLPQAFAVFAGIGTPEQREQALSSALQRLYDPKTGIVALLSPPFSAGTPSVGYITDYPAGIRENGGQYTHAAIWLARALLESGRVEEGWKLLIGLNPNWDPETVNPAFGAEPYAVPADICTASSAYGRGGWSLYTGAAGWFYRTLIETVFGLSLRGRRACFRPRLPRALEGASLTLRLGDHECRVRFCSGGGSALRSSVPPRSGVPDEAKASSGGPAARPGEEIDLTGVQEITVLCD